MRDNIMDFNGLNRFDVEKFQTPDSFFWPGYIWFWNDILTREKLMDGLHEMNNVGAKSLWAIPVPKDFRPRSMATNFEPGYLSDEYFGLYKETVKEMQSLDMKLWLYDEAGWPSGGVCGRIVRDNPSWAGQSLKKLVEAACGASIMIPDDCLSAFLYRDKTLIRMLEPGETIEINEQGIRIEIYLVEKESDTLFVPPYPDLLNPEVTEEFIRLTHEKCKRELGEFFGSVIPLVVSDEPRVSNLPWTDGLDTDFKREKGYDIKSFLPLLFQKDEDGNEVRIDFFDWWSRRFSQAFFSKIQKWCRENSLFYIGHLGGEDETLGSRLHGYGHVLRILRCFDIPGVDTIWKQIYPGAGSFVNVKWGGNVTKYPICSNHHFPKFASSVAHQNGKPWAWTESFSAYGSSLTLEEMKWITDFQFVRGINILIACQMHLSVSEHHMGSMRPIFGAANPLFRHMRLYHEYTARLSYLLSLGKPEVKMAVYFPVRDIWAGGETAERAAESNDTLARLLLESQCDFDMIDDDLLEDVSSIASDGFLTAGVMKYGTICISKNRYMSKKSMEKIAEFIFKGGKVLWVDNRDCSTGPEGSIALDFGSLKKHLKPVVFVKPDNKNIKVCKRKLDNGSLYFITNEGEEEAICTIDFMENMPVHEINPETGECTVPEKAVYSGNSCSIHMQLSFAGSKVYFFTKELIPGRKLTSKKKDSCRTLDKGWLCREIKAFTIGDREFELVDKTNEARRPIELGDWRSVLGDEFSGDAEYSIVLKLGKQEAATAFELDLGKVKGVAEVFLNGTYIGKKAWQPYKFDIKGIAGEGKNELKIIVTNTMANQFVNTNKLDKWPDTVIGSYHKQCLAFEEGFTESGIFGSVKVSFTKQEANGK